MVWHHQDWGDVLILVAIFYSMYLGPDELPPTLAKWMVFRVGAKSIQMVTERKDPWSANVFSSAGSSRVLQPIGRWGSIARGLKMQYVRCAAESAWEKLQNGLNVSSQRERKLLH